MDRQHCPGVPESEAFRGGPRPAEVSGGSLHSHLLATMFSALYEPSKALLNSILLVSNVDAFEGQDCKPYMLVIATCSG